MRLNGARNWDEFLGRDAPLSDADAEHRLSPTSPATSAFSAPASCPCANPATASRRSTAHRARSTGSARSRSNNCRSSTIRRSASPSTPTTPMSRTTISRRSARTGRRTSAPAESSNSWTRSTSTASTRPPRCRPTTCRSRPRTLQPFIAMIAPSDERARQAQAMLANWDAVMDKDRAEPLIFTAFLASLHRILLEDKTGLEMEEKGPYAATTLISLMRDHPSWCDAPGKPDPDCRKTLGRALDEGLALLVKRDGPDMSQWRWGAEHVALLQHQVFQPRAAARPGQRSQRAVERRLLHARPRRRLRDAAGQALRAHPRRRLSRAL